MSPSHRLESPSEWIAGRFRRLEILLEDGPRHIWRVRDEVTGQERVLKGVMGNLQSPEVLGIRQEFERLHRLRHPMLPACFELMELAPGSSKHSPNGYAFFTQELITGKSLATLKSRLSPATLRQGMVELLSLIAWLHAQKQVGLDLKPEHIFLDGSRWRLIDLDQTRLDDPLAPPEAIGAAVYMAPELLCHQPLDARSDLYGLGRTLLEVMVGELPPLQGTTLQACGEHLRAQPIPAIPPEVEQTESALARVLRALLAPDVQARPEALEALRWLEPAALERIPCPPLPFVGRESMMETIQTRLPNETGEGLGFRLQGPPRSGRSRCLQALSCELQLNGFPTLPLDAERLASHPGVAFERLLRFLEALSTQHGLPLPAAPGEPFHRAVKLSRALVDAHAPLSVVLLDDWQAVDDGSAAEFSKLFPVLAESGLVIIVTELAVEGPANLATGAALETLVLPPLDLPELRVCADAVLGDGRLDVSALQTLQTVTGGLAGHVQEALAGLWQAPHVEPETLLRQFRPTDGETLTATLASRMPPDALLLLTALSLLEEPFPFALVQQLSSPLGLSMEALENALRWLLTHAWLEPLTRAAAPWGPDDLIRFVQSQLRRRLEATVLDARKRQLHRFIGERLERRRAQGQPIPSRQMARHFIAAEQPERARTHLFMALEALQAPTETSERIACLRTLLPLLDAEDPDRPHLLLQLGEAELKRERFADALNALQEISTSTPSALAQLSAPEKARRLGGMGYAEASLGRLGPAREHLEQALELALELVPERGTERGTELSLELRLRWSHRLAWVLISSRAHAEATTLLERLRAEGIPAGSALEVEQIRYEAWLVLEAGPTSDAPSLERELKRLEQAITLSQQLKDSRLTLTLHNLVERCCSLLGRKDRAIETLKAAVELSRDTFDLRREISACQNLGQLLRQEGRAAEALTYFERGAALSRRLGHHTGEARSLISFAELLVDLERNLAKADEALKRAAALLPDDAPELTWLELVQVRRALLLDSSQELGARLDALRQRCERLNQPLRALETLVAQMTLALQEQRADAACQLAVQGASWLREDTPSPLRQRYHALAADAHKALAGVRAIETVRKGHDNSSPPMPEPGGHRMSHEAIPGLGLAAWFDQLECLLRVADEPEALLATLGRQVGEVLQGRGMTLLYKPDGRIVKAGDSVTLEQKEEITATFVREVERRREAWWCDNLQLTLPNRARSLRSSSVQSVACLPLIHRDRLLGMLYVDHHVEGRTTQPEVRRLLERVASLATQLLAERLTPIPETASSLPDLGLIGVSPVMQRLRETIRLYSRSTAPDLMVLLHGPSGTGKSFIARQAHLHGLRAKKPFCTVNMAGLPKELMERELCGHVKGAFTGATSDSVGKFGAAAGGSLLMDEIGELPLELQPKLLTALSQRTYSPLGGTRELKLDCHLYFATNADLTRSAESHRFRWDLLYRIAVNICRIPSLRERGEEDIRLLAQHLLHRTLHGEGSVTGLSLEKAFTPQAIRFLLGYSWPGNIRELENLFASEHIKQTLRERDRKVRLQDIDEVFNAIIAAPSTGGLLDSIERHMPPVGTSFDELESWTERIKCAHVKRAWTDNKENVSHAAAALKCTRATVYKYLRKGGVAVKEE